MIETIREILNGFGSVKFAYLFGSCAEGKGEKGSDVDIAVYLDDTSLDEKLTLHHALTKTLHRKVDLVVLNEVKNLFLLESILRKGIVLKDHEDRDWFEVRKIHEILDYKQFKRTIDAA